MARKRTPGPEPYPLTREDYKRIHRLAKRLASKSTIAEVLGWERGTFKRRCEEDPLLRRAISLGYETCKQRIRDKQLDVAFGDVEVEYLDNEGNLQTRHAPPNPAMLIWIGKQYLGQTDKTAIAEIDATDAAREFDGETTIADILREASERLPEMMRGDRGERAVIVDPENPGAQPRDQYGQYHSRDLTKKTTARARGV